MEIINLIFDIFNSPLSWMGGIPFLLGIFWPTKTSDDEVLASHINDLQTYKAGIDEAETITEPWTFRHATPATFRNDGDCNVRTYSYSNNVQDNPTIKHYRARGTEGDELIVQENDPCGEWTAYGWGNGFTRVARIYMDVDGTPGDGDMPGRIDFEVTPNGTFTPIVRMSLDNQGQLTLNAYDAGGSNLRIDGKGNENRDFYWRISGPGADYDRLILACEQTSGGEDFSDLFAFHYLGQFGVGTLIANSKMSIGINIHQAAYDNEALAFQSGDVIHGITDIADGNTYGHFVKFDGATGGLTCRGFTEDVVANCLYGTATNDNTAKNATALAPVMVIASKKVGTDSGAVGADANLFVVYASDAGNARFIVDVDGDILYDGTSSAFQDHDDIELLAELEVSLGRSNKLKSKDKYKKKDLEDLKILRPFLSTKRLNMLLIGSIRQLNEKVEVLEAQLNN